MKIKKIYTLIKVLPFVACIFAPTLEAHSDELVFSFSNPSFSGVGYSAHVPVSYTHLTLPTTPYV